MLEVWKAVVGYEGLYTVSDQGRVKSLPRVLTYTVSHQGTAKSFSRITTAGKLLKPCLVTGNRFSVVLCLNGERKMYLIAHLVASAFIGPKPTGLMVLHNNDVTTDDRVSNLRYGTHQDNMDDKVKNGKTHKGSSHHKAKLVEDQVRLLKKRLLTETDYKALASEFGVTVMTIQSIKHGRNWGWLE